MKHTDYAYRVPVDKALSLQLYKTCLSWQLTDDAEQDAHEKGVTVRGKPIRDAECMAKIAIKNGKFIVRFK